MSRVVGFSGFNRPIEDASFVVIGVPFDRTSTYRSGSRFGPSAIREASLNIETYSMRTGRDLEDLSIADEGDLHVVDDTVATLSRVTRVVADVSKARKIPIVIGGEHSVTLGAIEAFGSDVGVVSFDAHGDLRDEYMGAKVTHATFMRRIMEKLGSERIVEVGLRALCREEIEVLRTQRIEHFTTHELMQLSPSMAAQRIAASVSGFNKIYVSVDMDVLDPGFAPAVSNPEAVGLWPEYLISALLAICDSRVQGMDLVEVCPQYDSGATALLAARTIFESICSLARSRQQ